MTISESPCSDGVKSRDDLELVRRVLAGSKAALNEFTRRATCVPRLIRTLGNRLGVRLAPEEVADLSQEVLVHIWRRLASYEGRGSLETWAYRFCYYQLLNTLRQRRRRGPHQPLDPEAELAARPPGSAAIESYALLARCLRDLGNPTAEIIRQKHYEQRTFEQIGEVLGMPTGTVKTLYYRGLVRLRVRLKGIVHEEDLG